jgi:hypothetical protein
VLDAYDEANGHVVGTKSGEDDDSSLPDNDGPRRSAVREGWARRVRTCDLSRVKGALATWPRPRAPCSLAPHGEAPGRDVV